MHTVVEELSSDKMRDALSCFPTGVAIVTGLHPETGPVGLTISSFNSLSLDPPLILWSLGLKSASLPAFTIGRPFVVNILSEAQYATCLKFARSGPDKFRDIGVTPGIGDVPMIDGSVAQFQCTIEQMIPGGDHQLYIGRVISVTSDNTRAPLVFHASKIAGLATS
ncbi:MAG: flavin reductase family protein [Silicimonas sp.]